MLNQHLMTPFINGYVLYGKLSFTIIIQSVVSVLARCFKISLQDVIANNWLIDWLIEELTSNSQYKHDFVMMHAG